MAQNPLIPATPNFPTAAVFSDLRRAQFLQQHHPILAMSQFGAPSFSLGLDLDLDLDLDHDRGGVASTSAAPTFRILHSEDEGADLDHDDFDIGGGLGGNGAVQDPLPRSLKRLRRGAPVTTPSSAPPLMQSVPAMNVDEEIEEFSSDDCLCVGEIFFSFTFFFLFLLILLRKLLVRCCLTLLDAYV